MIFRSIPPKRTSARTSARVSALAALCAASLAAAPVSAQTTRSYADFVRDANANTVTIVSGAPGDTSLDIANDLATVLHCVDGLRIVPVVGRGDANNIYDLLFLRGVDMAIVRADVLDHIAESNRFIDDLKDRVRYVATLFEQEIHVIASDEYESIEDLEGKLVNIGATGTIALEARRILEAAGVTVVESKFDNQLALERVIDGGLDAMFVTGGKPVPLLDQLRDVTGLRLIPIASPPTDAYSETIFTHDDYPSLVPPGGSVPTIAVPSVLAVYNWPDDHERFDKNRIFTEAFYRRASYLRRPARHPKWANASLGGDISGWSRFAPAAPLAAALRPSAPAPDASVQPTPEAVAVSADERMRALFERQLQEFGIEPRNDREREQLFLAFKRRQDAGTR